jgi:predicted lipoprotein with Yx(FWY)xxD motif
LAGFILAAFGFAASAADPAFVQDGRLVTASGRTLYAFIGDHGRGETAGEGIHGLWHTVRP